MKAKRLAERGDNVCSLGLFGMCSLLSVPGGTSLVDLLFGIKQDWL